MRAGQATAALAFVLAACSGGAPERDRFEWECPPGWVAADVGGCGPAILLCREGHAAPGACRDFDERAPDPSTGMSRDEDGTIVGRWPAEDFVPVAGMSACPPGWTRRDDATCDPMLRADCPEGAEPLPGGACTPTSATDCPPGVWPDVAAEAAAAGGIVRYVRAGAPSGADGSQLRPYGSILEGLRASGVGDWLAVAPGSYAGTLEIARDVHIVGLCAARVSIDNFGTSAGRAAVVVGGLARVEMRGLAIRSHAYGVVVEYGAAAVVRATTVDATGVGVLVLWDGGSADVEGSVITLLGASSGVAYGVDVQEGSRATLSRSVVIDAAQIGLRASGPGALLEMSDGVVRRSTGPAVLADEGATAGATRVVVDGARQAGVYTSGADSRATLADVVIRDVDAALFGDDGIGLLALDGAAITGERVLVEDTLRIGVVASGGVSSVDLADSVVRWTVPPAPGYGKGLGADQGATFRLRGLVVDGAGDVGISANTGASVTVESSIVRRTSEPEPFTGGAGLVADEGAVLIAHGMLLEENAGVGAGAVEAGRLELRDSRVVVRAGGLAGSFGLFVRHGDLDAERVLVGGGHHGVSVVRGTLRLADARVHGIGPSMEHGRYGRAIEVGAGAATLERVVVDGATDVGIHAHSPLATITVRDALVLGVDPSWAGLGVGIATMEGGGLDLERVAVETTRGGALVAAADADEGCLGIRAADVWIRDTRSSTLAADLSTYERTGLRADIRPAGAPIASGVYAGAGCAVAAERAVVLDGGFGFAVAGTLELRDAVLARSVDAAGVVRGPGAVLVAERIAYVDNATDEVVTDEALPEASALPAPTGICVGPPCP